MSIEVSRREFLKIVFATVPAVAVANQLPFWPQEALARPIADPVEILRDDSGYLVDPAGIDFGSWPTRLEHFDLANASDEEIHAKLSDGWEVDGIVEDPENWTVDEIRYWLEESVELHEISRYRAAEICGYGPGINLYESLTREDSEALGLSFVDGCHPGSDFVGVRCDGDLEAINEALQLRGYNLRIVEAS